MDTYSDFNNQEAIAIIEFEESSNSRVQHTSVRYICDCGFQTQVRREIWDHCKFCEGGESCLRLRKDQIDQLVGDLAIVQAACRRVDPEHGDGACPHQYDWEAEAKRLRREAAGE